MQPLALGSVVQIQESNGLVAKGAVVSARAPDQRFAGLRSDAERLLEYRPGAPAEI
jgi:hypothetical protein